MTPEARDYIAAIDAMHRPLFDRVHQLICTQHPQTELSLSYGMPTYRSQGRSLIVGVWKHGLSIYGWETGQDAGFAAKHPECVTSKGTIQLRPAAAAGIPDDDLRDLFRAALGD